MSDREEKKKERQREQFTYQDTCGYRARVTGQSGRLKEIGILRSITTRACFTDSDVQWAWINWSGPLTISDFPKFTFL